MVTAIVNGRLEVAAPAHRSRRLEGGDVEMLQDLVIAAVNQALRSAQQLMADEMRKLTGGLKIPGLG